ncbi:MAG TPA: hypothetical protein DCE71_02160 [Parachlamydiales bacterium]|nr:hypothetical protein [Parachlamydiales bacterium]
MAAALEIVDEKDMNPESTRGEALLESVFRHLSRWRGKASGGTQEVKESIKKMEATIQSKLGERLDFSKMKPSEVFAYINDPAHFTMKEKALIHALLVEAGKLKKMIQSGGNKVKKIKMRRKDRHFV